MKTKYPAQEHSTPVLKQEHEPSLFNPEPSGTNHSLAEGCHVIHRLQHKCELFCYAYLDKSRHHWVVYLK